MLWEATAGLGHKRYVKLAVDLGNANAFYNDIARRPRSTRGGKVLQGTCQNRRMLVAKRSVDSSQ